MEDINNTALVFGFIPEPYWFQIDAGSTLISVILLLFSFCTFLYYLYNKTKYFRRKKSILTTEYILVCGLGKKASYYINSEIEKGITNILVIEKNPNNLYIAEYQNKGIAVKIGDASNSDVLKDINIEKSKHIIALAGKDTTNLEIALAVKDVLQSKDSVLKNFYMHVEDKDLNIFYKDGGLLDDGSKLLVKMFSLSRNSAKFLFLKHDIDGESRAYIDSDKSFGMAV